MYFQFALLFLTSFAAVVTSQQNTQACANAGSALAANQPCLSASTSVGQSIDTNTAISIEELTDYCTTECRALTRQVLTACSEPNSPFATVDITAFVCTIDGDVSCFDLIRSSQFTAMLDTLDNGACANMTDAGQTCSPECAMDIQNVVNAGGCCFVETLQFAGQFIPNADLLETVLSACSSVTLPQDSCQVIGEDNNGGNNGGTDNGGDNGGNNGGNNEGNNGDNGANGLVVSGSVLLIAAIMVTVFNH